jgi:hypothetical protein
MNFLDPVRQPHELRHQYHERLRSGREYAARQAHPERFLPALYHQTPGKSKGPRHAKR